MEKRLPCGVDAAARAAGGEVMDRYERVIFWSMAVYIGIDACRNLLDRFL
jgi:hypothetical protein